MAKTQYDILKELLLERQKSYGFTSIRFDPTAAAQNAAGTATGTATGTAGAATGSNGMNSINTIMSAGQTATSLVGQFNQINMNRNMQQMYQGQNAAGATNNSILLASTDLSNQAGMLKNATANYENALNQFNQYNPAVELANYQQNVQKQVASYTDQIGQLQSSILGQNPTSTFYRQTQTQIADLKNKIGTLNNSVMDASDAIHKRAATLGDITATAKQEMLDASNSYNDAKNTLNTQRQQQNIRTPNSPTEQKHLFPRDAVTRADLMKFGSGAATAAGSGFGLFNTIGTMVKNGANASGIMGAAASLGGLYAGLTLMKGALITSQMTSYAIGSGAYLTGLGSAISGIPMIGPALMWLMTTPWGMLTLAAIIVAVAILKALFGPKPTAEEAALEDLNQLTIWDTGRVLMMTSAAAFLTMGYNIDRPMDLQSAGISIPTVQLRAALGQSLVNADGSAYTGEVPYNTPIVIKGTNGQGDKVAILTKDGVDSQGRPKDRIKMYDLAKNMAFESSKLPSGAYIPFFIDGKVNPEAVRSVNDQRALLQSVPALNALSQQNAALVAGASNKDDTTAVPY